MSRGGRGGRRWAVYLAKRALGALTAIFGIMTVTFVLTQVVADPVYLIAGTSATPEIIEDLRHHLGLDRPVLTRYVDYLGDLVRGDFGNSLITFQPIRTEVGNRLPATLELSAASLFLAICLAVPAGFVTAIREGGRLDRACRFVSGFFIAVPGFWLGLLLTLLFYFVLGLAPLPLGRVDLDLNLPPEVTGFLTVDSALDTNWPALRSSLAHLVLPAITVALTAFPALYQLTSDTMSQTLRSQHIQSTRSLGLSSRTIYGKYALRNVLPAIVTMIAMIFGWLVGNMVLIEVVFAWPGLGQYAVSSLQDFDYLAVMGVVIVIAVIYSLVYLAADIIGFIIDPRIEP